MRRMCPGPGSKPCPCRPPCRVEVKRGARGGWQTPRCPECKRGYEQVRRERRPLRSTPEEIERRHGAVQQHVATYGWVCLGDDGAEANDAGHRSHACMDLTADHITPVGLGSTADERAVLERGPLRVMCRSRNSQLGALAKARARREK